MEETQEKTPKEQHIPFLANLMITSITGLFLVACVLCLLFVGLWIDTLLRTTPLFLILGGIAGFAAGIKNAMIITKLIK